ncbi:MAG: acyl-CoA desaturase [Chitinophagaceae bacterium]|nr:acyl-CoA desaturase [Chitinophagaceae bacterium]
MAKVTFNNTNNLFYHSLKAAVDEYFEKKHLKKTGNWRLYLKTVILISSAVAIYSSLLFLQPSTLPALLLCVLLGYNLACIGFSVMHDANHGSYCTKTWANDLLGLSMNAMGASAFFWKQKHNILHHTYTNVDGLDDDIAKSPIIRQCESQRWVPAHKIQHLYLLPVYALSTLFWVFTMDFAKYFTGRIYTTAGWKLSIKNHIIFWATKILYVAFYMVIPAMVWGVGPWLAGYLLLNAAMGLTLSIVFQLAHVVEVTEFETVALDETKHIETAWAEHELRTTANFAMGNKIISWFVGGLNYQVEHHLFPKVSHIHYPAISKIVMEKCKEFDLPYNKYDTMMEAVASHFRIMKRLGQSQVVQKKKPHAQAA